MKKFNLSTRPSASESHGMSWNLVAVCTLVRWSVSSCFFALNFAPSQFCCYVLQPSRTYLPPFDYGFTSHSYCTICFRAKDCVGNGGRPETPREEERTNQAHHKSSSRQVMTSHDKSCAVLGRSKSFLGSRRAMRKVFEQNAEAGTPNGIQIGLTVLLVPGWYCSFPNRILPSPLKQAVHHRHGVVQRNQRRPSPFQVPSQTLPSPPQPPIPPHARESRPQMAEHCRVRCS